MMTRRDFALRFLLSVPASFSAVIFSGSCGEKKGGEDNAGDAQMSADPCSDLSGVSENDIELRKKFAYVKESPIADNQCNNCNLFLPPKAGDKCGGCLLFKGPVYPSGYCTYWAPKV